ncbi:MAG: DUF1574 family protein [Leptospiraceae bacterium]|nr:DUF1574 family protein [Leptospiraceae bacterium]
MKSKNLVILYPIILFILLFLIDKIFLFPEIRKLFISWKRFEVAVYETRLDLIKMIKEDSELKNGKKLFLVLGSSRSAGLNSKLLEEKLNNNARVYNFSVPFPEILYYDFIIYQLEKEKIQIEGIFLELDSILLTKESKIYTRNFSLSIDYIWDHYLYLFNTNSNTNIILKYIIKKLFITSSYPISFLGLIENLKTIQWWEKHRWIELRKYQIWDYTYSELKKLNESQRGGFKVFASNEKITDIRTNAMERILNISNHQVLILEKTKLLDSDYKILIYSPPLSSEFLEVAKNENKPELIQSLTTILAKNQYSIKSNVKVLDLRENNLGCREFEDSIHLAKNCMDDFTSRVGNDFPR